MEFSRQESWSGLPFPFPGDLPHPGMQPGYLALQADSLLSEPPGGSELAAWHTAPGCLHAKLLQSCLTLWDPVEHSPPGSPVHEILQRTLEWVAISSSRDLPDLGFKLASLMSPALAGGFFTTGAWKALEKGN